MRVGRSLLCLEDERGLGREEAMTDLAGTWCAILRTSRGGEANEDDDARITGTHDDCHGHGRGLATVRREPTPRVIAPIGIRLSPAMGAYFFTA